MIETLDAAHELGRTATHGAAVDLRGATTDEEVFRRLGLTLKGAKYEHSVETPNFDMLQELVEDWFDQNWGSDNTVVIYGVKEMLRQRPELMLELILMLSRAEMWALERRVRANPKADTLTPYLNLRVQLD